MGEVAERGEDGEGLPLPMGEVAERSEDGEGRQRPSQSPAVTALALSVTCGDSFSPLSHLR